MNPGDEAVDRLTREHPGWQVWVVYRVIGGPVWCARRWEDADAVPARVINASTPDELALAIAEKDDPADT